jgi:hypothetical protein
MRFRAGMAAMSLALVAAPLAAGELQPPLEVSSVTDRALAARPGDSQFLVIGDRSTNPRIDRAGLTGRGINLRLSGDKARGQIGGQNVDLVIRGERIDGHVGAREVSLEVGRLQGALKVTGRFGSRAVSEDLTPSAITADVGPCSYLLRFQRSEYSGQVNCGAQPEGVRLRVPATLVARRDVELATLFTALLSR